MTTQETSPADQSANPVHRRCSSSRAKTISREEVELELDAAIGSPWESAWAKAKLDAMSLSREDAIKQAFRNGVIVGAAVTALLGLFDHLLFS